MGPQRIQRIRSMILIDRELNAMGNGVLGDIAPTILDLMGVQQPKERHSVTNPCSKHL